MRRIPTSWLIAIVVLIAAALWVLSGQFGGEDRQTAAAPQDTVLRSVRVAQTTAIPREEVLRVLGHTQARRKVDIRTETDGRIVELPAEKGQRVNAGDVIVRLATDDRQARLQEARALLRLRQIEYDASKKLRASGFRAETSLADAEAKLDAARAQVKRIEVDLSRTTLAAPFDGVLERRNVELGAFAKTGEVIGTVVDLTPLRVIGYVAERDVARLAVGGPGEAALPDGTVLSGTITFVGKVADPATRTFLVEIEVPNPEGKVAEGLTAEMRLPVAQTLAHRLSPALLTLSDTGTVGVKIVDESDTVRFVPVSILGDAGDGQMWVGGLPERLTVVSVGQEFVRDGQKVRPVSAAELARKDG